MKKILSQITYIILILGILTVPFGSFSTAKASLDDPAYQSGNGPEGSTGLNAAGQAVATNPTTGQTVTTDPQGAKFNTTTQTTNSQSAVSGVGNNLVGCTAGTILASLITQGLTSVLKSVGVTQAYALTTRSVPVTLTGPANSNIEAQTSAHTMQNWLGIPTGASWDSISWCIVNSIITYITDSTIAWANSGFNGNPAFVQNPDNFFKAIANQEAGKFVQQLAYNTTGINVCQPFRAQIAIGLANSFGSAFQGSCSINQIMANYQGFQTGASTQNFWQGMYLTSQYQQNNPYGATMLASNYMNAQITNRNNSATLELNLGQGWLGVKKCDDNNNPATCKTVTPGNLIFAQTNQTLGLSKERLVMANKFDQLVTALVNGLIRVALNKVLQPSSAQGVNATQ